MTPTNGNSAATLPRDLTAGVVVFLVSVPLCLGVAQASGAPLLAGVLAGIVGGIVVGLLSGSHTVVSGPPAALTVVVAAQIAALGSFQAFLLAVVLAGLIQIGLGFARAGFIAAFIPSSVVKGLLAAIGVLLILKEAPHVLGHDPDPQGEMAFQQVNRENTFTELAQTFGDIHPGAAVIGLASLVLLSAWTWWKPMQSTAGSAPLIVVLLGVGMSLAFRGDWAIGPSHLVQVPVADSLGGFLKFLDRPDFSQWTTPAVYTAAVTVAAVASLESLLSLDAVDKLDPRQRVSPPSRELLAQGVGNVVGGLVGAVPITAVVARSSLNINAGATSKLATIVNGIFLLVSVVFLPTWLNYIPLACLAAILLVTGVQLANPALVKEVWTQGPSRFVPFAATVAAIVLTDLLTGILIGLAVSAGFILHSNLRRPVRRFVEKHLGGEVLHVVLANQVSFLNRAALAAVFDEVPRGGHVLLDAQNTDFIDPDVLDMIREFKERTWPARGVEVSLVGFRNKYQIEDQIQYVDYSTRDLQEAVTPAQVLQILKDGHERFRTGQRLTRDLSRQVSATAQGQHPLAVVFSCIDSRSPAELIFDSGFGDIFSVRIAGNVPSRKVLASIEYACAVAGAKLILVLGHTRCGAVTAAVKLIGATTTAAEATGCQHIDHIVHDIQTSADAAKCRAAQQWPDAEKQAFVDTVTRDHVARVVRRLREDSRTLDELARDGRILIVGAIYDVVTGEMQFLPAIASQC